MYGYIYETTNLINGKKYVGQKKSDKFLGNEYLGSGKILKQAVKKYGINNFKVRLLKECNSQEELNLEETTVIKYYKEKYKDNCYNISNTPGTWNLPDNFEVWNKGIKLSDNYKKRISIGTKRAMQRPEVRKKILARNSKYLYGNNHHKKGSKLTEEQKAYISKRTKEAMQKIDLRDKIKVGLKNMSQEDIKKQRKAIADSIRGRVCYNNGVINKMIHPYEEEKYINMRMD